VARRIRWWQSRPSSARNRCDLHPGDQSRGKGAARTLRMATIAPGLGQAITMAGFANIVTDNRDPRRARSRCCLMANGPFRSPTHAVSTA